jgi:hypothetical protein
MDDLLPPRAATDLVAVLIAAAQLAWTSARAAARAFAPVVRPPRALRVRADDGREYSGLVLIKGNEILFGIVVCTGHGEPVRTPTFGGPIVTPPPRDPFDRQYMKPWASDPRDEEDEPWRR